MDVTSNKKRIWGSYISPPSPFQIIGIFELLRESTLTQVEKENSVKSKLSLSGTVIKLPPSRALYARSSFPLSKEPPNIVPSLLLVVLSNPFLKKFSRSKEIFLQIL